jgi:hypothetical protein
VNVCLYSGRSHPTRKSHPFCATLYLYLWAAWLYNLFPHYLINVTIFRKRCCAQNVCFDFLYNFCLKHFSFNEELSKVAINVHCLYVKCTLFLSNSNENWIFSTFVRKILKYQVWWKSNGNRDVARGQTVRTYMTKLMVAFRNFRKAPNKGTLPTAPSPQATFITNST